MQSITFNPAADAASRARAPQRRHIEAQCATLVALARRVLAHGADTWARETATGLLRFFDAVEHDRGAPAVWRHAWQSLRAKLIGVQGGQSEWIRRTEVFKFVELHAEYIAAGARPRQRQA